VSYIYLKKTSKNKQEKKKRLILAYSLLSFGVFILFYTFFPIIKYQFQYASRFGKIINPLSTAFYNQNTNNILGEFSSHDYTQLNNWFADSSSVSDSSPSTSIQTNSYYLSIPSLKIDKALVKTDTMDLKSSLIQYPQTAFPGQLGNSVVFGHSVLPQFFNPKSYLTIFSNLFKLKKDDKILIDYDNISYTYLVEDIFEVKPNDLSVLEQRYDNRYLTLITCSPPGTYLRRLIIKSKILD
jgi:sortase A